MRLVWPDSRFFFHRRARSLDSVRPKARTESTSTSPAHLAQRLAALSESQRLPLCLALLSAVLVAPSLFIGFQLDDFAHRFCTLRTPESSALCPDTLSPFTIATGHPETMRRAIELGLAPFWSWSNLLIHFFRPLSGLSHTIDYHLFPNSPALMHAENIAWLAGAVFFATLLYRRTMGVGTASAAAAFVLAVDHVHGVPVGWIANRNAVMAACLGTAAIVAYERSTRSPSFRTTLAGVSSLLLGLLSGELALGAWAFLLAHALVLDRRRPIERMKGLLPYAAMTVAWRAVYSLTGHGALGSSMYVDPMHEPLAFLRALPERLPLLLQAAFSLPPAEAGYYTTSTLARVGYWGAVLFAVSLVIAVGRFAVRSRVGLFFALGTALSLVSICTAVPHNRLLFFPSLGAMGLLAVLIDAYTRNDERLPTGLERKISQGVIGIAGGLHAFVSPILLPFAACTVALTHSVQDRAIPSAIATMTDVPHQDLVILSAPELYSAEYVRLVQRAHGKPEPEKLRVLGVGSVKAHARRLDAHTLAVSWDGGLVQEDALQLYRSSAHPMKPGDRVALDGLDIVVTEVTSDGRPAAATLRFAERLDSPKLRWVVWENDHYVPFTPPDRDGAVADIARAESPYILLK